MAFETVDWLYRLGFGQIISLGVLPSLLALLLISAAIFLFIKMDDRSDEENAAKERNELLQAAELRVRAYRAGFEQQEKESRRKMVTMRKRLVKQAEKSNNEGIKRKVSFNLQ